GMESLFAYVFHLMIVYGSPINPNLSFSAVWGNMLSYHFVFGLFIVLATTTFFISYFLHITKQRKQHWVDYIKYAFVAVTLLVFFINPY
ncbi:MAG: hypothetical protein ACK44H_01830, partial [Candidatus Kryptonium sp.]